jgi:hypothetical protein
LLEFSTTSGANPDLAGLASKEKTAGFEVADDERIASASSKTVDASGVGVDGGQEVKPELAFRLAVAESDDLLGRVGVNRGLVGAEGRDPQLLMRDCPVRLFYG